MYSDEAYAPFGEAYAQSGTLDLSFTGMNQDTHANVYDFPVREYGIQGRWPSPDPAGTSSMHLEDPQTLNRYAYVRNSPLAITDPDGEDFCDGVGPPCMDMDASVPGSAAFTTGAGAWSVGANINLPSSGGGDIQFGNTEFDALNAAAKGATPDGVYEPQGVFSVSATAGAGLPTPSLRSNSRDRSTGNPTTRYSIHGASIRTGAPALLLCRKAKRTWRSRAYARISVAIQMPRMP
jgi:RHS repeat-associated protein